MPSLPWRLDPVTLHSAPTPPRRTCFTGAARSRELMSAGCGAGFAHPHLAACFIGFYLLSHVADHAVAAFAQAQPRQAGPPRDSIHARPGALPPLGQFVGRDVRRWRLVCVAVHSHGTSPVSGWRRLCSASRWMASSSSTTIAAKGSNGDGEQECVLTDAGCGVG